MESLERVQRIRRFGIPLKRIAPEHGSRGRIIPAGAEVAEATGWITVFTREAERGWDGGTCHVAPRIVLGIGQESASVVEGGLHTAHAITQIPRSGVGLVGRAEPLQPIDGAVETRAPLDDQRLAQSCQQIVDKRSLRPLREKGGAKRRDEGECPTHRTADWSADCQHR